jgi:hypothetical protein
MTDLLVADSTGLFPVVTCTLCQCLPTQHRCLATVTHGGVIFGTGTVCGIPICSPCNASYNEEHVVRCHDHCKRATEDGSSDKENEQTAATRKPSSAKQAATRRPSSAKQAASLKQPKAADNSAKDLLVLAKQAATAKQPKAADYSAKDLLVLAQAYIRTSENAIEGTSQKKNKFWDDVAEAFKHLKVRQEEYDKRAQRKKKYTEVMLKGDFLSSDDDDDVEVIVPVRTSSSLQQKWSKFLLPLVTKFIGLTNRHPKLSGEGESYFLTVSLHFL